MVTEHAAYTYETFPEYTEIPEDAVVIPMSGEEVYLEYSADVVYATKDGVDLHLQIIKPVVWNHPNAIYPIVLFVKGSAWMKQDVYKDVANVGRLAERGYVTAIVEYRHSEIAHFPAQICDAKDAIRYMREHAAEYQGDPENIVIMGGSSGGQVATLTGMTVNTTLFDDHPESEVSLNVKAIVDMFGAVDVLHPCAFPITTNQGAIDTPEGMLMGFDLNKYPERVAPAIAKTYVTPEYTYAPILIIHGTKDIMCNTDQSVQLYEALKKAGKEAQLYLIKGSDHGGACFWSDTACDIYDSFFKKCMAK